jgi:hypothetical protein
MGKPSAVTEMLGTRGVAEISSCTFSRRRSNNGNKVFQALKVFLHLLHINDADPCRLFVGADRVTGGEVKHAIDTLALSGVHFQARLALKAPGSIRGCRHWQFV